MPHAVKNRARSKFALSFIAIIKSAIFRAAARSVSAEMILAAETKCFLLIVVNWLRVEDKRGGGLKQVIFGDLLFSQK